MKQILFACILLGALSACTEGGILNKEKKYTPLCLYYNPFQPAAGLAESQRTPEKDYPNYLNYPNDCVKHGLRGQASLVSYIGKGIVYFELSFDKEGKLIRSGSYFDAARRYAEVRDFKYDSTGKPEGVYRNGSNLQEFEYDASGKLVKRKGGLTYAYQTYTYYNDGTLKEITPHMFSDHYLNLDFYGKMEFNESGELAKADFMTTSNPFFGNEESMFRSVCTFAYADDGLCTNKNETMYYKEAHPEVDSICCHNVYTYNDKGDVLRWDYSDTIHQNKTSQSGSNLTFMFEYKYDRHDNWTTMKIILPDCYIGNPRALANFARDHDVLRQLFMGVKESNEPATITIQRQISYHAFSASESKVSSSEAERKPNTPLFTAIQGHGLYGKIKSLHDSECTINFDEYGNIASEVWKDGSHNDYNYQSPTRYVIDNSIGPFRITCDTNTRKEEDEGEIEPSIEYKFDTQGRVIVYKYAQGMMPITEKYTYSENKKCPDILLKYEGDEEGTYISTSKYTYLEFDKEGNWIKRKVNRTWEITGYSYDGEKETEEKSTEIDPEFTEYRNISYY